MNKVHFFTNEAITEEDRQRLRELDERQAKEREEVWKNIPEKAKIDFMGAPFRPFEDRILVFPDPVEVKTASGIYVPDQVIEKVKPLIGTVVRVGPGKDNKWFMQSPGGQAMISNAPLKEGMRIYYGNYAGTDITINGIKYLIMRYSDCFGEAV